MNFSNQHYLVTGAAGGLGREVVRELIQGGARVSAAGRDKRSLKELENWLKEGLLSPDKDGLKRLTLISADLATEKGCTACVRQATKSGKLDGLIHCAGIGMRALARETSVKTFEEVVAINFHSLYYLFRAAREELTSAGGSVVAVSSVQAYVALPGRSAYVAGKHALHGLMKTLRLEEPKLSFLTVTAGYIRTNFSTKALSSRGKKYGKSDAAQKKGVPPEVAARRILRAMTQHKREIIISGWKERAAIFLDRHFPALYERIARGYAP